MSEPRDELADADIISSGGEKFDAFWGRAARSRWTRMAAIPVLVGLVALFYLMALVKMGAF